MDGDKEALLACERWDISAQAWIDAILLKDDVSPEWDSKFYIDTQTLLIWVAREMPSMSTRSLQDYWEIVRKLQLGEVISSAEAEANYDAARQSTATIRDWLLRRYERGGEEVAESPRPAYTRDHQFLVWNEEGSKPANIRDKWNALSEAERKRICPTRWETVGREVVVTALKKAKKERKI